LLTKFRKIVVPFDTQLSLFDVMVAPIILYGSEVWGVENIEIIDRFQLK
jgi:hypothetical protein